MRFKGIEVVRSKRKHAGSSDFWVDPNGKPVIHTIYDSSKRGFRKKHAFDLHHEAGHVCTLFSGKGNQRVLRRIENHLRRIEDHISEEEGFIHSSSLRELRADLYAWWQWVENNSLADHYKAKITNYLSPDHNIARRLFFNILETGKIFGESADVTQLKGEYIIVGGWDVGKSSLVNFLLGEERARVVSALDNQPTSDVSRYEHGGLVLYDTPPIKDRGYDDEREADRLERLTLGFIQENEQIPIIYAVLPRKGTNARAQADNLRKLPNVAQIVFTQGDDPTANDNLYMNNYGEKLPHRPITISTITGEGIHKLIQNIMAGYQTS